jgi:hypothetical protein
VPKCENFHRTDSFYFYTIKPLWVGDFRAKIKSSNFNIEGVFWGFFFENFVLAHTECALKNFFFQVLMFTFELIWMLLERFLKFFILGGFLGFFKNIKFFGFLAHTQPA